MRINESCINHNAVRLISQAMDVIISDATEDADRENLITLGYVDGVTELAEVLKEVLAE